MNTTLVALLVLLLLIPGVLFQHSYFGAPGSLSKTSIRTSGAAAFGRRVMVTIVVSLAITIATFAILSFFDHTHCGQGHCVLRALLSLILSPAKDYSANLTTLLNNWFRLLALLLLSWLSGYALGFGMRYFIRKYKLDRTFRFLRFDNEWYYRFSGEYMDFPELPLANNPLIAQDEKDGMPLITVLVQVGESSFLYSGLLLSFHMTSKGDLDYFHLLRVHRTSWNNSSGNTILPLHKWDPISKLDEQAFVLPYSEVKNLHIRFFHLQTVSKYHTYVLAFHPTLPTSRDWVKATRNFCVTARVLQNRVNTSGIQRPHPIASITEWETFSQAKTQISKRPWMGFTRSRLLAGKVVQQPLLLQQHSFWSPDTIAVQAGWNVEREQALQQVVNFNNKNCSDLQLHKFTGSDRQSALLLIKEEMTPLPDEVIKMAENALGLFGWDGNSRFLEYLKEPPVNPRISQLAILKTNSIVNRTNETVTGYLEKIAKEFGARLNELNNTPQFRYAFRGGMVFTSTTKIQPRHADKDQPSHIVINLDWQLRHKREDKQFNSRFTSIIANTIEIEDHEKLELHQYQMQEPNQDRPFFALIKHSVAPSEEAIESLKSACDRSSRKIGSIMISDDGRLALIKISSLHQASLFNDEFTASLELIKKMKSSFQQDENEIATKKTQSNPYILYYMGQIKDISQVSIHWLSAPNLRELPRNLAAFKSTKITG